MSTEELTGRKAKKAQRDAERKKTVKKRKREEDQAQDLDGQDELKNDFVPLAGGDETAVARDVTKKRKVAKTPAAEQENAPEADSAPKAKKRRKSKPTTSTTQDEETAATTNDTTPGKSKDDDTASSKPTKSRFILFIGNLPYTATDATITAHFKSIQPFNLRHRTDPKTKKSKGFAFLEFENYDRMKTCLKLYHHSLFDPDAQAGDEKSKEAPNQSAGKRGKKDKSRKINVELTAGGGGKGDDRKEKIKVKNQRLEEQRQRRREAEEKAEAGKEKKQGLKKTGANAAPAGKDGTAEGDADEGSQKMMEGVHPARLAQMKKA